MDLLIKFQEPQQQIICWRLLFQEECCSFFFFFEDVYRFPGSGAVMDSNAAKEIIHSCPISTYEAPINNRPPGLEGRPGSC